MSNFESKSEFLRRMSEQYDKLYIGLDWAEKISQEIKEMRNKGYSIIIMGDKVKVSLKKD
jgi:hypothetical protein